MLQRKPSLVNRAFWNFLGASILTTVAAQLAVSTDAAIVSHLMGPHAMAAVNMAMPVLTTFLSLNSLLGVGASLLAAKAIGSRDSEEASRVFTAALYSVLAVGVVVTVASYACCEQISRIVCADDEIRPMVLSYLRVTSLGVTVLVLSGMMNMMVQSDGRPRLVTCAVIVGAVTNVVLDIVFIKMLGLGIAGSAWATVINYGVTVCITSSHLRRKSCSYRIVRFTKQVWHTLGANLKQGLPLMIANVLLSVIVLLINKMVDGVLGSDGVYMVAVCIQLLLITFVVLNGVLDATFAIGGMLLGEHDITGLKMLNRKVMTFSCTVLVPFSAFVAFAPRCDGYALRCRRPNFACRTVPSASHLQCHTAAVFAHRAAARHVSGAGLFGAECGCGCRPGSVDRGGGVCVHASGCPRYALVGFPALGWRNAAGAGGHHLANEPRQKHFAPHADTSPRCGAYLFRHGAEWASQ
ncbi:MAG: MATE family efflux transporter [Sodaliphilus sp.]|nr:MATE family efflux transporter [Sodaliphilus sp.]